MDDEPVAPVHAWVTQDAARRLVALGGHELDALVELGSWLCAAALLALETVLRWSRRRAAR